jgi:hypothetical protein
MENEQLPSLVTWQDFFNFEAERVSKYTDEQLDARIREYSKVMFGVQAFQHACIQRHNDIISEEKKKVYLEDMKYVPPVSSKTGKYYSERVSKEEKAIKTLMATLKINRHEAESMLKQGKKLEWEMVKERGLNIPEIKEEVKDEEVLEVKTEMKDMKEG